MATGILCNNGNVIKLAGANASVVSTTVAYTDDYINGAEGVICALCRYDYVTNYALLTDIAKDLLREAAATYSAIQVIQYDMSGYTSRIEAENMINILWARWQEIKVILEDQKFSTWTLI